ncbi:hypothetical protein BB050_01379 [Flavobacterium anhuiense]|uniref:Uncharacterized protein n=1 Tax=Flavobacterium anhuiense TaxID=459526 RepID=A0AAC9D0N2_9FLAO|nr:hypothetical protein BB050_01379 [Flavobacterium anhuiense]
MIVSQILQILQKKILKKSAQSAESAGNKIFPTLRLCEIFLLLTLTFTNKMLWNYLPYIDFEHTFTLLINKWDSKPKYVLYINGSD